MESPRPNVSVFVMLVGVGAILHSIGTASGEVQGLDREFRQARFGHLYQFPRDHGSHDDFRTEWWYYTGHLTGEDGRRFGYQLTFFRRGIGSKQAKANPSRWAIQHLYLAHFALSDFRDGRFRYAEKVSRAGLGKAGADTGRLHAWIDHWSVEASDSDTQPIHHLQAAAADFAIDLNVMSEKPPTIHGAGGVSRKGAAPEQASHYYSLTRLATTGTLLVKGERLRVTGISWMDHEFGSGDLGEDQIGWDWFSLQLTNRTEVMIYLLRRHDGTLDPASSGTWTMADGQSRYLSHNDIRVQPLDYWNSKASGARYPSRWRITIASLDLALEVTPLLLDQELITQRSTRVTYWEGAVHIAGSVRETPITGNGYVELTGYARAAQ
jgi:predicted secreted hydrolase